MKLINDEILKKNLRELGLSTNEIEKVIDNQPVAFDKEKVIDQIEEIFGCDPMYYNEDAKFAIDSAVDKVQNEGI